ncbi:hypothetical protein N9X34_02205 [Alphaproteobacteria bacterium]|jgi:hypothetical protein|nr:hypothetical protein [Alphaproteobacteria bacterium]
MFKMFKCISSSMLKILVYGLSIVLFSNASAFAEFKCPKTSGIFKTVDLAFLNKKDLVGIPTNISNEGKPSLGLLGERELLGQRGMHYPPPPISE